ncbi:CopM family metallochaperone [Variovorax sp. HJSM1_2]|uniref:CopM family metallochaperone n=1 Tax=Variovorax sp. HJSM1_2 TaxID=3366263 RepID=UPI003BDBBC33
MPTLPALKTLAAGVVLVTAFGAHAQQPAAKMDHGTHGAPAASATNTSPSTKAYLQSDEKMMKGMSVPYTGDADKDFVSHMIAHHQGAVDMAQVLLKHGKDPELRKMAQDIIKAQESEIAFMKQWQAKNGVK